MNKYYYESTEHYKSPLWREGCLADILEKYKKESCFDSFQRGVFFFESRTHSTGCHVVISIWLPKLHARKIVDATYWSNDQYRFNPSTFESGAWDSALEKEIDGIISDTEKLIIKRQKKEQKAKTARLLKEQQEKEQYEKYFLNAAKFVG